jgi:hypothetical protein
LHESNGVTIDGLHRTDCSGRRRTERRNRSWAIAGNTDPKDSDGPSPHHRIDDRPSKLGPKLEERVGAQPAITTSAIGDVASPVRSPYGDQSEANATSVLVAREHLLPWEMRSRQNYFLWLLAARRIARSGRA